MSNNSKYMLRENDAPLGVFDSLESAKAAAASERNEKSIYQIESLAALARSRIWIYDHKLNDWVEQL